MTPSRMTEEPEHGEHPMGILKLKLPVYRPLLYTDTLHGDQISRDDMWAVKTEELNTIHRELVALRKVMEAANRAVMLHNHASIFCTTCFVDMKGVDDLRAAINAAKGERDEMPCVYQR